MSPENTTAKQQLIRSNGDSQGTDRILMLLSEYSKDNATYYETMYNARKLERRRSSLRRTLMEELKSHELNEFCAEEGNVRVKLVTSTPQPVIDSEEKVPSNYFNRRSFRLFDMHRLKSDLAQGKKIPGVHLETANALDIDIACEFKR